LGRGRAGQVGHTQPRRIAARTVAERISEEITGSSGSLGDIVGYQVRFTDTSSDGTLVKVMTDGILLAQIQRDPELLGYDTIIIDEAHERSLNIDFLLGYLTNLLPRRPDLKIIITSATIDSERFAEHFAAQDGTPAPIVEVTGRTYPVEIRYRPLADEDGKDDRDLPTALCEAVDELVAEGPGDILAFFSGEREIRDAADALTAHLGPRANDPRMPGAIDILPLYGRQSAAEQHRIFSPHGTRRVVLATNVAETSLTVPGIRYVIDTGTARISRYSKATKVQRLPIEPISQASANQRSGRCGRVADGIAIRLYSEADFESRPEFTEPEILRTSLASVILQMISVGVASTPEDVTKFPFVDKPDTRAVRDGVTLLRELGALEADDDGRQRLTTTGRALAELPIDPRLARMIVEAGRRGVAREVMVITAALSIQDPRERPTEARETADALHARFTDPTSDFLAYLNLWEYLRTAQRDLSGSAFRRTVRAEHLHYLRIREWQDLVAQLKSMAKSVGIPVNAPGARVGAASAPTSELAVSSARTSDLSEGSARTTHRKRAGVAGGSGAGADDGGARDRSAQSATGTLRLEWDADRIHVSLLAGLLSQVGQLEVTEVGRAAKGAPSSDKRRKQRAEYRGARGARFQIWPGSGLVRKAPAWVMAGELVETSRLWARDVAAIKPEWAEELGAHLVTRSYSEPSWSTKQGAAMVLESVLLYGLPVVSRRRVLLGKVDPEQARELFLRHALVEGEWTTHHKFFHANRELLAEAERLEARARRRDLVLDEDALLEFYDERVGAEVVSARHFDTWWKAVRREQPELLTLPRSMVLPDEDVVSGAAFPLVWPQGDLELALSYQFEPGTAADGVTVHVPLEVLPRVREDGFDWLVPGLRDELVVATIRSLPKPVRVQLVPAPDVARDISGWLAEHVASWEDTVRAGDAAPSFRESFARAARELRGVVVAPEDFDPERLPAHLRVTFRVEEGGRRAVLVDEGPDLGLLQRRLAARSQDAVRAAVRSAVRSATAHTTSTPEAPGTPAAAPTTGLTPTPSPQSGAILPGVEQPSPESPTVERDSAGWLHSPKLEAFSSWPDDLPGGELPERVDVPGAAGLVVHGYPALVELGGSPGGGATKGADGGKRAERSSKASDGRKGGDGGSPATGPVGIRVLGDPASAANAHHRGLRRLLVADVGLATARITTRWNATQALTLAASPYPTTDALVADLQLAAVDGLLDRHLPGPATDVRSLAAYTDIRAEVRARLEDEVYAVAGLAAKALGKGREVESAVRASSSLALLATCTDLKAHVAGLLGDGFVSRTGSARLGHLARYLEADLARLDKAAQNPERDASLAWQVTELTSEYEQVRAAVLAAGPGPDAVPSATLAALEDARWMLEELRVSLFAQQLGTPTAVSPQRIRKALGAIGR
ncbi:MAG: ATP-dependent RNA helicase HrpA, partial [Actinomycetales bacterium]|nr:ATP-dependent RNA helicase HrpA [Actinomycetales bacterium]